MEKETRAGGLKSRGWILHAILALMVFAVSARIDTLLFQRAETPDRDSIEGGYRTIARFVAEHPNPWGWKPIAYYGVPTEFTYVPAPPVRGRVALLESYVAAMHDASRPRLAVERAKMGFMFVHAESGEGARIRLRYGGTAGQRAIAAVSALAWTAPLVALARNRRERTVEAV
jgi:hypothetical protein